MKKISKNKTIATYARAWLDAAKEQNSENIVLDEVRLLQKSIQNDEMQWSILSAPTEDNKDLVRLITDFANDISLSKVSCGALELIATNRRLNLLEPILKEFCHLYYSDHGIIEVTVDTAIDLNKSQHVSLLNALEKKLGASVVIDYCIKPEILGGLNIRFQSFQINDTLAYKLNKIKQLMLKKEEL